MKAAFNILLAILLSSIFSDSFSQNVWVKTFGGTEHDEGNAVQQTSEGDYIVGGFTKSFSEWRSDGWLFKTDGNGDLLWDKKFNWGRSDDIIGDIIQTTDDGIITLINVTSYSDSGSKRSLQILKISDSGEIIWESIFSLHGNSIIETFEGNYLILGNSFPDFTLFMISNTGDSLWTQSYVVENLFSASSLIQCSDSNFIVTANFMHPDLNDQAYLLKINQGGEILWSKHYGENGSEIPYSLLRTNDNNLMILGTKSAFGWWQDDIWLMKINNEGEVIWSRTIDSGINDHDMGYDFIQNSDGSFVITGTSFSDKTISWDLLILKTDSDGNLEWLNKYGNFNWDVGESIAATDDGGYIITGYTGSIGNGAYDVLLVKTDSEGNTDFPTSVEIKSSGIPKTLSLEQNYPNPFNPTTTIKYEIPTDADAWPDPDLDPTQSHNVWTGVDQLGIHSNPVYSGRHMSLPQFHVKLTIYNILGHEIETLVNENQNPGNYQIEFDGENLTSGVYFYRLTYNKQAITRKFLLLK